MGVNPNRKSGVGPLRRFAGEPRQHLGNSCSVAVVSSDALHSQPDFIGYTERGAVTLGQLTVSISPRPGISVQFRLSIHLQVLGR